MIFMWTDRTRAAYERIKSHALPSDSDEIKASAAAFHASPFKRDWSPETCFESARRLHGQKRGDTRGGYAIGPTPEGL